MTKGSGRVLNAFHAASGVSVSFFVALVMGWHLVGGIEADLSECLTFRDELFIEMGNSRLQRRESGLYFGEDGAEGRDFVVVAYSFRNYLPWREGALWNGGSTVSNQPLCTWVDSIHRFRLQGLYFVVTS